nr:hypothetical protein [Tanacetum cinerariifolium]
MKLKKLQVSSTKLATKRLLKEKLRIEEEINATTNVHCPATLKDALPPKEKDTGSFTLSCIINNMCFDKALADLRASVSVMHYSTFTNLGLVITVFAIVENMDAYRDKDIGDVIVGKPFCRVACVEAKRFYGFITIHDGNDSVTYQMVGSHPTFKHLSNKQCNKIWLLLQVSARDILKENSHSYQKKVSSKESWIWDPNT